LGFFFESKFIKPQPKAQEGLKGGKNKQNTGQAKEFQNAGKPKPPKEKTALKKQGKQQA
jgi:hypothetical protein